MKTPKGRKRKKTAGEVAVPPAAAVTTPVAVAAPAPVASVPDSVGATVSLASICTVKDAATLRQSLSAVIGVDSAVLIDAGAVERIDTATIQLLCAFVRDRLAADREVRWRAVPPALVDAAKLLGVQDLLCLACDSSMAVAA
jgi:anti-anti-sigma regulatory factor